MKNKRKGTALSVPFLMEGVMINIFLKKYKNK
jgi:hypothetical protein